MDHNYSRKGSFRNEFQYLWKMRSGNYVYKGVHVLEVFTFGCFREFAYLIVDVQCSDL